MVSCVGFMVFGVEMLFGLVPFKTCPLFALMFVSPLFFFFCLVWSPTTFFFLSLSQALGKPKPRLGFGFPLVFSSCWTRTSSTTRTPSSATTPRRRPRTCLFFFFFSRRRRSLVCWLVSWRSVAFLFGLFFGLWWWVVALGLSVPFCIACKMRNVR